MLTYFFQRHGAVFRCKRVSGKVRYGNDSASAQLDGKESVGRHWLLASDMLGNLYNHNVTKCFYRKFYRTDIDIPRLKSLEKSKDIRMIQF